MKILYHIPSIYTISAGRPNHNGYRNAFEDLGHEFRPLTADSNQQELFDEYQPDILITGLGKFNLKYLDLDVVKRQKKLGLKIFVNTPFWKSSMSKLRINEQSSISENEEFIELIKSGDYGDVYYNVCEEGDPRMEGFEEVTGYKCHKILLAADKVFPNQHFSGDHQADISFIGSYLPERRNFFKEQVLPLKRKYDVKLYVNDMRILDRTTSFAMKVGQYFNIPLLRSLRKNNVSFKEEKKILVSSQIAINFHEDHQKQFGDFNDRVFKIPISNGFQICDNVETIKKYLKDGEEIVIARDKNDWFEKIDYYIKNPDKRLPIIEMGRKKVLSEHTYHNRVNQMLDIYRKLH